MLAGKFTRQALSANAIDIISEAIVWFNEEWLIIDGNRTFLSHIAGSSKAVVKGNLLGQYLNPQGTTWVEVWGQLVQSKGDMSVSLSLIKDGTKISGSLRLTSVENREVGMLVCSAGDLSKSQDFDNLMLQSIIDLSPAHINYYDADLNFLFVNKGFLDDFRLTKEEVIGKSLFELVGKYMGDFEDRLYDDLKSQRGGEFNTQLNLPGVQELRFYHGIYEPHFDADESLLGYTMIVMDLTSQKSIENALRESESRLKLSLDASKTGIFEFNIETGYSTASDNLYEILGYQPQEFPFSLEKWRSLVHPADVETAYKHFNEYLDSENEHYRSEYRILRKDRSYQWMSLVGKTVEFDEENKPLRILGLTSNVHFRKQVEEGMKCLIESKNSFQGPVFFENITRQLSQLLSTQFTAIAMPQKSNPAMLETLALWEYDHLIPEFVYEIKGSPCELVYRDGNDLHVGSNLSASFPKDALITELGVDSYYGVPFFNSANEVLGHLFTMDNKPLVLEDWLMSLMKIFANTIGSEIERMTEERKLAELNESLESQVQLRTRQLEDAMTELDTFFYRASHDLRGPITTLQGIGNILEQESVSDGETTRFLEVFVDQVDRMNALNTSIIEVGNIRQWKPQNQEVDLQNLVLGIFQILEVPEHISYQYQLDHKSRLTTDPHLLSIILTSMIQNSLVHRQGDRQGSIDIKSKDADEGVMILIEDDGVGIPREACSSVFDMFFKATVATGGFGLGLYKAKIAADKLGVDLNIQSSSKEGTCFSVFIPEGMHVSSM